VYDKTNIVIYWNVFIDFGISDVRKIGIWNLEFKILDSFLVTQI